MSKFIIYSPYRVLMDLLIMKKKWNIIHIYIYNIFRNKTLYIYKKEVMCSIHIVGMGVGLYIYMK